MRDPKERFSDRVENYAKYRPGYPEAMVDLFQTIIPPPATVADIGSGTGILTRQLLDAGYELFAVEPNKAMRGEAEQALSSYPGFHSMPGAGESTTLGARSIALITCAQAFHWLDREKTKVEFSRILEANGVVALIWNERLDTASLFNREYADLLGRMAPEYQKASHRKVGLEEIRRFFAPGEVELKTFKNYQILNREGFLGRLLSSSYVPNLGQPGHLEIMEAAAKTFDSHHVAGQITLDYETKVFLGRF